MSVSGLCQVCEAAEATAQCDRCGTMACRQHYDRERGLCMQCAGRGEGDGTLRF